MSSISNIRPPLSIERQPRSTTMLETGATMAPETATYRQATPGFSSVQLLSASSMSELLAAQAADPDAQARAQAFMDQLPEGGAKSLTAKTGMTEKEWDMIELQMRQRAADRLRAWTS